MAMTALAGLLMMTAAAAAMPSADAELERVREAAHSAAAKVEAITVERLGVKEATAKYLNGKRQSIQTSVSRIETYVPGARKNPSLELTFALLNEAKVVDDLLEDLAEGLAAVKGAPPDMQQQQTTWFREVSGASLRLLENVNQLENVLQRQLHEADARMEACSPKK